MYIVIIIPEMSLATQLVVFCQSGGIWALLSLELLHFKIPSFHKFIISRPRFSFWFCIAFVLHWC